MEIHQGFLLLSSFGKISLYWAFTVIALLFANHQLQLSFRDSRIPIYLSDDLMLGTIIWGWLGASFFASFESGEYIFQNGYSWYGGVFSVSLFGLWRLQHFYIKNFVKIIDILESVAPAIILGYAIGRLGCMASGDGCYGIPCPEKIPTPFCMKFEFGSYSFHKASPSLRAVWNTPLIETIFAFLSLILVPYLKSFKLVFPVLALIHALVRFIVEFIRLNPEFYGGLTQAQWISLFIILLVGIMLTRRKSFDRRASR